MISSPDPVIPFDLLLKDGRVTDPASGRYGLLHVAIADKEIAAVDANIPAAAGSQVVDVTRLIGHAWCYRHARARVRPSIKATCIDGLKVHLLVLLNIAGDGMVNKECEQDSDDMQPKITAAVAVLKYLRGDFGYVDCGQAKTIGQEKLERALTRRAG